MGLLFGSHSTSLTFTHTSFSRFLLMSNLTFDQLRALLDSVFALRREEKALTIIVDLPGGRVPDSPAWKDRRRLATEWFVQLQSHGTDLPFLRINLCAYENVGSNNADLPEVLTLVDSVPLSFFSMQDCRISLYDLLSSTSVILAPTELSATAPLKILAKKYGFRGATLPGLNRAMIPSLGLDYESIDARVQEIRERMDRADSATIVFSAEGQTYGLTLDLRFRSGHASGGLMREPGVVANLPSGEAYIVPYEGEKEGVLSNSAGLLPVQFGNELVVFTIENNRCIDVRTAGNESSRQRAKLLAEPAYGNISELGVGVLGELGVKAVGSTLLDEKLGLHVAFGRSDHFGGVTSPASFRNPENVIHIDWVYVPATQPGIQVASLDFSYMDGGHEQIMKNDKLVV
jgi:hypothetical protein